MKKIYTDGACKGNPGKGGWAYIVVEDEKETSKKSGFENNTTNQRAEMLAVINALQDNEDEFVEIYSDSAYIVNCFADGWMQKWKRNNWIASNKKPVANRDLWERMDQLVTGRNVYFIKVKGHNGDLYNEKVDKLASDIANKN